MHKIKMKETLGHSWGTQMKTWQNESKLPWNKNTQFYNNVKTSILPEVIHKFNVILIKYQQNLLVFMCWLSAIIC